MGSLNKVQTPDEFKAWLPKQEVFVSLKLDGISIRLRYVEGNLVQAVTRGDGEIGEDITPNVRKMNGVVLEAGSFTGDIRGEIVLRKSVFEKSFKSEGYKNCRNAAGGAAKDLKGGKCHLLSVMCYKIRRMILPILGGVRSSLHFEVTVSRRQDMVGVFRTPMKFWPSTRPTSLANVNRWTSTSTGLSSR